MYNQTTMKKSIQLLLLFVFAFIGFSQSAYAQDEIVKKNGKKMSVWIKEVSDTQIKYIEVGDPNEIIFTIDRVLVKSVEFSYGKKMKQEEGEYSDEYFYDDKCQNLKINFLALRGNDIILTYERALSPQTALEMSLKILGFPFFDNGNDHKGVGMDVGYKMKLKSLFKKDGSYRPDHLLHGSYAKPMIGFHGFNYDNGSRRTTYRLINVGIDVGKQWILNKTVSLDIHIGFHYYGGSEKRTVNGITDDVGLNGFGIGDLAGGENVAASLGFRIGYLFGNYGNQQKGVRKKR